MTKRSRRLLVLLLALASIACANTKRVKREEVYYKKHSGTWTQKSLRLTAEDGTVCHVEAPSNYEAPNTLVGQLVECDWWESHWTGEAERPAEAEPKKE
jgi:hypothetical protein